MEPQEYSRNVIGIEGPWQVYYIPATFLGFPVWGSI